MRRIRAVFAYAGLLSAAFLSNGKGDSTLGTVSRRLLWARRVADPTYVCHSEGVGPRVVKFAVLLHTHATLVHLLYMPVLTWVKGITAPQRAGAPACLVVVPAHLAGLHFYAGSQYMHVQRVGLGL
jgi:hypothetical protein